MLKRTLRVLLCTALALLMSASTAFAEPLEQGVPIEGDAPVLLLADAATGKVIFEKNADDRRPVASVVKLMPILLAVEAVESGRVDLGANITASEAAQGMGGSQVLIETGGVYKFHDLLKSMIISSANDATIAVAEQLYGGEKSFVAAMNKRARQLGLNNTNYVNCTGLPVEGQYTSARDVMLLSRELFKHDLYFEFSTIWMDNLLHPNGRKTEMTNTNRLIRTYNGADGGKTGSTDEAGYCVSATAMRDDMRLIAVVLGASTGKERFAIAAQMFDYGFAGYRLDKIIASGQVMVKDAKVVGGDSGQVNLIASTDSDALVPKGSTVDAQLEFELPSEIMAPLAKGEAVGIVKAVRDGEVICEQALVSDRDVNQSNLFDVVLRVIRGWIYK